MAYISTQTVGRADPKRLLVAALTGTLSLIIRADRTMQQLDALAALPENLPGKDLAARRIMGLRGLY